MSQLTRDFPGIIEYYDDEGFSHPTHIDDDAGFRYLANIYDRVEPSEEFGTPEETRDDGRAYAAWNLIYAGYCGFGQREEARRWLKDENCLYELNARHNDEFRKGFYTVIDKFLAL